MNKRTLAALRGSIAKWRGIVEGTVEDEGSCNCPLCQIFYEAEEADDDGRITYCAGCPVKQRTGKDGCRDSPYMSVPHSRNNATSEAYRIAAQAELDFLISLLPEGETP